VTEEIGIKLGYVNKSEQEGRRKEESWVHCTVLTGT